MYPYEYKQCDKAQSAQHKKHKAKNRCKPSPVPDTEESSSCRSMSLCPFQGCNKSMLKDSVGRHVKTVHLKIRETCKGCNQKFSVAYLPQHQKQCIPDLVDDEDAVSKKLTQTCDKCQEEIICTNFESHHKECSGKSTNYKCNILGCNQSFRGRDEKNNHVLREHHNPDAEPKMRLAKHSDEDTRKTCYKCKKELRINEQQTHICQNSSEQYNCRINGCAATFSDEANRLSHEQAHTKTIKCPITGCQTQLKLINLKKHIKLSHQPASSSKPPPPKIATLPPPPPPSKPASTQPEVFPVSLESLKMLTSSNLLTNLKPLKISNVASSIPSISIAETPTPVGSVSKGLSGAKLTLNLKTAKVSIAPNFLTNLKTIKLKKCFKCNVKGCMRVFEKESLRKIHLYKDHIEPIKKGNGKAPIRAELGNDQGPNPDEEILGI